MTGSTTLSTTEVAKIYAKRKFLEKKLPKFEHLAVIYTNREYTGPIPTDPNTCIIAKDGMSFAMSPTMKWVLAENL
jgi:hypothetical protein